MSGEDYDVGYGKPPKHTRFKKGVSGNPKGRPKGSSNFNTDLDAVLEQGVRVKSEGQRTLVTTQRAMLQRLLEKALNGDFRALNLLLGLAQRRQDDKDGQVGEHKLQEADQDILNRHAESIKDSLRTHEDDPGPGAGERQ